MCLIASHHPKNFQNLSISTIIKYCTWLACTRWQLAWILVQGKMSWQKVSGQSVFKGMRCRDL
jgi:hypothetical protein